MKFSEDFKNKLEKNINGLMEDDDVFSSSKLDVLEKNLSIYNIINNIEVQEKQLEMFKQSQDMMKNVDFSNFDVKGIL